MPIVCFGLVMALASSSLYVRWLRREQLASALGGCSMVSLALGFYFSHSPMWLVLFDGAVGIGLLLSVLMARPRTTV